MAVTTRTRRVTPPPAQGATTASSKAVAETLVRFRAIRGPVPVLPAALVAASAALEAEEALRTDAPHTRDGRRSNPLPVYWAGAGTPRDAALATWRAAIAASAAGDRTVDWRALRLDRRDGALYRAGGQGLAVTEHALGQLLTIVGPCYPRALTTVTSAAPYVAAAALAEHVAASSRGAADPVVVRLGRLNNEPMVRAVVTPRHSLAAFDDLALARVLEGALPADARVGVSRAALGRETRGWAYVPGPAQTGLDLSVHWRNSETGEARLAFRAGVRIRALDVHLVSGATVSVEVAAATGGTERNHTLPTVGTEPLATAHPGAGIRPGVLLTDAQRERIADDRMRASYEGAVAAAEALAAAWAVALTSYPDGVAPQGAFMLEVLEDLMRERGLVPADADLQGLRKVLTDDARLQGLPRYSAAHVAAGFAVLAVSRDAEGNPRTWEEAERLQRLAGRWAMAGWDAKAHQRLRGNEEV